MQCRYRGRGVQVGTADVAGSGRSRCINKMTSASQAAGWSGTMSLLPLSRLPGARSAPRSACCVGLSEIQPCRAESAASREQQLRHRWRRTAAAGPPVSLRARGRDKTLR
ncbi:hypothetical protein NDU88_007331 [Pleurodeles waltl]|uniref:Uncharacterized protein n=1 Tax=Pleurodeles waltl TaxID=8319 RepID=A0AAV7VTA7_PLEWA|nr:hypothetical protein NDU88_007331 [Pleurodeles waltl]